MRYKKSTIFFHLLCSFDNVCLRGASHRSLHNNGEALVMSFDDGDDDDDDEQHRFEVSSSGHCGVVAADCYQHSTLHGGIKIAFVEFLDCGVVATSAVSLAF